MVAHGGCHLRQVRALIKATHTHTLAHHKVIQISPRQCKWLLYLTQMRFTTKSSRPHFRSISINVLTRVSKATLHLWHTTGASILALLSHRDRWKSFSTSTWWFVISNLDVCLVCWLLRVASLLAQLRLSTHAILKLAGSTGEGSTLWLWLNGLVSAVWWLVMIWMVLLIMGSTLWAGLLYGKCWAVVSFDPWCKVQQHRAFIDDDWVISKMLEGPA